MIIVDSIEVEGVHHSAYVKNGWADSVGDSDLTNYVRLPNASWAGGLEAVSKGERAYATHQSDVFFKTGVREQLSCVVWKSTLELNGQYDMLHREPCALSYSGDGPVGMCTEIAQYEAKASSSSLADLLHENTVWPQVGIANATQLPAYLQDGFAYVYEELLAEGDQVTVSAWVNHEGAVGQGTPPISLNSYHGYTRVEVRAEKKGAILDIFAGFDGAGLFLETDAGSWVYTAEYTGIHRLELIFGDQIQLIGKNARSNAFGNRNGDYQLLSEAEVAFCR